MDHPFEENPKTAHKLNSFLKSLDYRQNEKPKNMASLKKVQNIQMIGATGCRDTDSRRCFYWWRRANTCCSHFGVGTLSAPKGADRNTRDSHSGQLSE